MTDELRHLYGSLQRCLELRDKYMRLSRQRLGDNPRDHDGVFTGLDEDLQGVAGVKPYSDYAKRNKPKRSFQPWKIYPKPPPPHWHWKDTNLAPNSSKAVRTAEEFDFAQCEIPGEDSRVFSLDEKGVYQVYNGTDGMSYSCLNVC